MLYNHFMPHFFINTKNINENIITVTDQALLNHLLNARRVKIREKLLFIDEHKIQYETIILDCQKKFLTAEIIKRYPSFRIPDFNITVARCVLKQDADFSAIQKATELGVSTIIPLYSDNCVLKRSVIKAKEEKFQKVADESVKQCERADFPNVLPVQDLDSFITKNIQDYDKVLVFSERAKNFNIKNYFKNNPYKKGEKILAIFGCEGGFSEREFSLFEQFNLQEITLGKLILRADTALVAGVFGIIQEVTNE